MSIRKIRFLITEGSHFPEKKYEGHLRLPIGGIEKNIDIEFDTKEEESPMDTAFDKLKEVMGTTTYHIWYWWWWR
jgi:hypothetical protein